MGLIAVRPALRLSSILLLKAAVHGRHIAGSERELRYAVLFAQAPAET